MKRRIEVRYGPADELSETAKLPLRELATIAQSNLNPEETRFCKMVSQRIMNAAIETAETIDETPLGIDGLKVVISAIITAALGAAEMMQLKHGPHCRCKNSHGKSMKWDGKLQ